MVYPQYETLAASEGPELFRARRAFRSIISHMFGFFVSGFIVVLIHMFLADSGGSLWGLFSVRWLAIIPVLFLLEIMRKYHDDLYVFSRYHITHYEGRLSLSSSVPALKYGDILGISIEQDLLGRILNYGNILLDTAGDSRVEMTISGVRAPGELAQLIEKFRLYSSEEAGIKPASE